MRENPAWIKWLMADKMLNDRILDLMDAYALHEISRDEFVRRMTDILGDWHDAHTEARMIRPEDCDGQ